MVGPGFPFGHHPSFLHFHPDGYRMGKLELDLTRMAKGAHVPRAVWAIGGGCWRERAKAQHWTSRKSHDSQSAESCKKGVCKINRQSWKCPKLKLGYRARISLEVSPSKAFERNAIDNEHLYHLILHIFPEVKGQIQASTLRSDWYLPQSHFHLHNPNDFHSHDPCVWRIRHSL